MKLLALSILSSLTAIHALPASDSKKSIDWKECDPEIIKELNMTKYPIQQPVQCGSLKVPFDYTGDGAKKLDLALLRVKATEEPFRGSVLVNPGGPGGSGVQWAAQASKDIQSVIGGGFDIIGFDPRGTGKTIPFTCMSDVPEEGENDASEDPNKKARRSVYPLLPERNLTQMLLGDGADSWEDAKEFAQLCYETRNKTGEYISTAFVARDMVHILDALGEDGMLRYWGTSYGTQLGATFAAMFPDRIDRVLLDANMNLHDYVAGTPYATVKDTDSVLLEYLTECVNAPEHCSVARKLGEGTTVSQLLSALGGKLEQLRDSSDFMAPWYYEVFILQLYGALYEPRLWSGFADKMVELLDKPIETLIEEGFSSDDDDDDNEENGEVEDDDPYQYNEGWHATTGITCIDNNWRADSAEEIMEVVKQQDALSTFSHSFFPRTWLCPAWKMTAREAYTGNFTASTKNPILFVNGRWDPVTPLISAFNSSAGFEGSVVLTHNGYGHGFTSHPSTCTAKAVRAYFEDGVLPKPGTQCDADIPAFEVGLEPEDPDDSEDPENAKKRGVSLSSDDAKLHQAMLRLNRITRHHIRL